MTPGSGAFSTNGAAVSRPGFIVWPQRLAGWLKHTVAGTGAALRLAAEESQGKTDSVLYARVAKAR